MPVRSNTYSEVQHMARVIVRQTGKKMTKPSVITNRLSVALAGLIIDYLFSSDYPASVMTLIIGIDRPEQTV